MHWLSLGELSRLIETFQREGVARAVMAGQVKHKQIFSSIRPDWRLAKLLLSLRTRSTDFAKQRDFILGDAGFDGDKGLPVGVRPWDHQLRQAVLLAALYMVVASAPMEGFLHRLNDLDTLGDDEPETPCHLNK